MCFCSEGHDILIVRCDVQCCTPLIKVMGSTVVDWPPWKSVRLHWQQSQSMRLVRTANKGRSLICGWLIVEDWAAHVIYGVLSLFILTEQNLTLARQMKSHAYARIWHDEPCFPRLQPECDFFASGSRVVSVRKLLTMIFNNLMLCRGLGLRCWVT